MSLCPETRAFLSYLRQNESVRDQICAPVDQSLFYAGDFFMPVWKELEFIKVTNPAVAQLCMLPDVLSRLPAPDGNGTLKKHVEELTEGSAVKLPWKPDGFIIWRALSGIFASNAVGKVYFYVGSRVTGDKVLAATEIGVLGRNPHLHPTSQAIVEWLQKCLRERQSGIEQGDINFGFLPL
jgi:hypothetical protein